LLPPPLLPKEFKFCAVTQFIANFFCLIPLTQSQSVCVVGVDLWIKARHSCFWFTKIWPVGLKYCWWQGITIKVNKYNWVLMAFVLKWWEIRSLNCWLENDVTNVGPKLSN
jgi:hypothetical protein